jgi:hypothetical protein
MGIEWIGFKSERAKVDLDEHINQRQPQQAYFD